MPQIPIIMPQLGESIAEATVIQLFVNAGDAIEPDQDLLEVETNKATMAVPAPCRGTLAKWVAQVDTSYAVGTVLGYIEATAEEAARLGLDQPTPKQEATTATAMAAGEAHKVEPRVRGLPVPAHVTGVSYMSPRMKARMAELGLHAADLAGVAGSGAAGRVTIEDFEKFLTDLEQRKLSRASSMRVAVADAMRRSWTRPLATVGLPARIDAVLAHRKSLDPKPGPTLYAIRALALALAANSAVGGRLVGNRIVHPSAINIGFAVEAEDGVLVPVIRDADKVTLRALVGKYAELLELARQRRLPPEATAESVATVTNYGTFGLTWATPIPLPEQTLVLGLGVGRKVPFWDEEKKAFVPVTEAQLTLSFDHRVLDGGAAGRLLQHIAKLLAQPETL